MDKGNKSFAQSSESIDIRIARLAFIGASISTLGDGLQALAAGLALESLQRSKNQTTPNQDEQTNQTDSMQDQIDYIINELNQFKKMMQ